MAVVPEHEAEARPCDCIEPLLAALRPDQAALIRRLDLSGEPREEMAAELGILPNALHVRHHRARRALAAVLLAACAGCPGGGLLRCACPGPPPACSSRAAGAHPGSQAA